ncbi:MAG TPA: biotin--[acetyl-CoA-carboxylase] ligase [Thermoanaerobaculia bacterium]|nr:biotin--[acetyl-CoA-carboxylase] ligase [Thermoanaerobaculia bacterium]
MIDTEAVVNRLHTIESLAVIARVKSTNLLARRIVNECLDNELSLPQAMIVAREQLAGRGRHERSWSSPAGKGIYATTLVTRTAAEMAVLPLSIATIIARYLIEVFGIDARIKWPNDILVGGRKIAGVLLEARVQEQRAYVAVGIGVNLEPVKDDDRPNAVSVREVAASGYTAVDDAIIRFIEYVDDGLTRRDSPSRVLEAWRELTVHQPGDPITCVVGDRTVSGTWMRIDDQGRAILRTSDGELAVAAGDLIV